MASQPYCLIVCLTYVSETISITAVGIVRDANDTCRIAHITAFHLTKSSYVSDINGKANTCLSQLSIAPAVFSPLLHLHVSGFSIPLLPSPAALRIFSFA